jgi:hypothetical protein
MTLPTLDKTWEFDLNNVLNSGVAVTNIKDALLALKTAIVAAGWSVVASSDAVAYGNSDKWIDTGDLVWNTAANARSWCELQADFGLNVFRVLLECQTSSVASYPGSLKVSVAQDAFTGGTTTVSPTSTSETIISTAASSAATQFFPNNTTQTVWHSINSDDHECFRWILCQSSKATSFLIFDRMKNPLVTEPNEYVAAAKKWANSATDKTTLANFNTAAGLAAWDSGNGAVSYYMTVEFCGTTPITTGLNGVNPDDGSAWPLCPIGLVTLTDTSFAYGRNGEIYDLWWGCSSAAPGPITGSAYDGAGSLEFAQFGHLVFPWDGATTPQIA